jgi:hypothetical protein
MILKSDESITFDLTFAFSEPVDLDSFRFLLENVLFEMGEVEVSWPEETEATGTFDADTEYTVPVDFTPEEDFDDDSIKYALKKIKKEMAGEDKDLVLIKIAYEGEEVSVE